MRSMTASLSIQARTGMRAFLGATKATSPSTHVESESTFEHLPTSIEVVVVLFFPLTFEVLESV